MRKPNAISLVKCEPPKRKHGRMLHRATLIDAKTSCFGPDVHERRTIFLIIIGERCFGRRKLFENHVGHNQSRSIHGVNRILAGCHRAGDDVHFHRQTSSRHADRIVDSILIINDEFLR